MRQTDSELTQTIIWWSLELFENIDFCVQNGCSISGDMPIGDRDGEISDNEFAEFEFADEPSDDRESSVDQKNRQQEATFGGKSDELEDDEIGGEEFGEKVMQHGEEDKSVRSAGEFSFLADEEEFEEFPARSDEAEQQQQKEREGAANKPPKPLTFAEVPSHFRSNWSSYQVELLALLVIFVYALNYAYGKSSNHAIAHKWFLDNRERLEKQFALVGDDGTSQENLGGRVGCRSLHTQIKLCKRQDLLGMVIGLFRPRPDHVVHKIDLDPDEMDSFVLIFGQRKNVQKTVKEMHDLSTYVTERKNLEKVQLPVSFCVFAEIAETIPAFIDTSTLQFLKKCEKFVEYIHFSDQYAGAKQPDDQYARLPETHPTMVFSYFIADENGGGDLVESMLLNFTFFMLDKVRRYRLSREGKAKADKKRQNVQENFLKVTHQQRQEAAQTRREEKTRERKQRVMEEEDPDRQKRLEKLELKRDAKQKQPKMKQFKIK
uniref:PAT complex subunit CCDC47 n=1 Tax=Globodera rostochiensis TaxID=31243 RepID=A0A914HBG8_GLORO